MSIYRLLFDVSCLCYDLMKYILKTKSAVQDTIENLRNIRASEIKPQSNKSNNNT